MSETERVTMVWPKDLKDAVREKAGPRGITEFAVEAVEIHLGVAKDLRSTDKELNEVKFFAQQLADQLVLGTTSPEERLQSLMEVEFPAWIDTSGWPQSFAERVRPEPITPFEAAPEPEPESKPEPVAEEVVPDLDDVPTDSQRVEMFNEAVALAETPRAKVLLEVAIEEEFKPKDSGPRDDLFARVMAKTQGKLDGVPGLKLASDIPKPEPVVMKDLCPKCGDELVDGECWTCG